MYCFMCARNFGLVFGILALIGDRSVFVTSQCDTGWSQLNGKCYYVDTGESNVKRSWHDARIWCQQQGGDLAVVNDDGIRTFTYNLTHHSDFHASLWLGLSRAGDYKTWNWVDGSMLNYSRWHDDQPSTERTRHCAYQYTRDVDSCFHTSMNKTYTYGLSAWPKDVVNSTMLLGFLSGNEDGCTECEEACMRHPDCEAFTAHFTDFPHSGWAGRCIGRSKNDIYKPDYALANTCGGVKVKCTGDGNWYTDNCGAQKGYICEKPVGGTLPPPPDTTTPAIPGYCPRGFHGIGNKCFYIHEHDPDDRRFHGYTWLEALEICKYQPGLRADMASFHSEQEMAEVAMHMFGRRISFWIGMYRDVDSGQWMWSDNSPTNFMKFKRDPPDSGPLACAEMETVPGPIGTWAAADCTTRRGFICQLYKDPSQFYSAPPIKTTTPVPCEEGQVSFWHSCYEVILEKKDYMAANRDCLIKGGHLVSIRDGAENYAMVHHFLRLHTDLWLGLRMVDRDSWKWMDDWPTTYVNWGPNEPSESHYMCAVISSDGLWKSVHCSDSFYPLCEFSTEQPPTHPPDTIGDCPNDEWKPYGGHCYYISEPNDRLGWDNAKERCENLAYGAKITSIHGYQENKFIFDQFRSSEIGSEAAFIGFKEFNKVARWADNTPNQFVFFAPGQPDFGDGEKRCGAMMINEDHAEGFWAMERCEWSHRYACKIEKKLSNTTIMPTPEGCPTGSIDWGPYCFWILDKDKANYKNYSEAETECAKLDAHLSVHNDDRINQHVSQFVWKHLPGDDIKVWFGLTRNPSDWYWFHWATGAFFVYHKWDIDAGEPRKGEDVFCGYIKPSTGLWGIDACHHKRPVLCQRDKPTTTVITTTTSTTSTTTPTTTTSPLTTHFIPPVYTRTTPAPATASPRPTAPPTAPTQPTSTTTTTTTRPTTSQPESTSGHEEVQPPEAQTGGLSTGSKVGVAFGVIIGVVLLGIVGWFVYQKFRKTPNLDGENATSFSNPIRMNSATNITNGDADIINADDYSYDA